MNLVRMLNITKEQSFRVPKSSISSILIIHMSWKNALDEVVKIISTQNKIFIHKLNLHSVTK